MNTLLNGIRHEMDQLSCMSQRARNVYYSNEIDKFGARAREVEMFGLCNKIRNVMNKFGAMS